MRVHAAPQINIMLSIRENQEGFTHKFQERSSEGLYSDRIVS